MINNETPPQHATRWDKFDRDRYAWAPPSRNFQANSKGFNHGIVRTNRCVLGNSQSKGQGLCSSYLIRHLPRLGGSRHVLSFHLKEEWQLNKGGETLLVGSPTPAALLGKARSKKAWLASFPTAAGPPGKAKLITSPLVNKSIIAISVKVSQV